MVIWRLVEKLFGKQKVNRKIVTFDHEDMKFYMIFKRAGNVVNIETNIQIPANKDSSATIINITNYFPEFAKYTANVNSNRLIAETERTGNIMGGAGQIATDEKYKIQIAKRVINDEIQYALSFIFHRKNAEQVKNITLNLNYIVDDEDVDNYVLGDINGDGVADAKDLQLIQDYIMGYITLNNKEFKAADINKDGKVTSTDYMLLKEQLGL